RWKRKRKLLPNLRLRYPNDNELHELAELAKVDNCSVFGSHIRSIILDAHLNTRLLRNLSAPRVQKILTDVASRAQFLSKHLRTLDVGQGGSAERAGLIELQLLKSSKDTISLLECIDLLQALSVAAHLPHTRAVKIAAYNVGNLSAWWGDKRLSDVTARN